MLAVIDGQGGGFGKALIAELRAQGFSQEIIALGTNAAATAAMLKGGASCGATGENAIVFNCQRAEVIAGPIGIVAANSLLGEMSDKMALAVCASTAKKVLIPVQKCNISVVGIKELNLSEYITLAAKMVIDIFNKKG